MTRLELQHLLPPSATHHATRMQVLDQLASSTTRSAPLDQLANPAGTTSRVETLAQLVSTASLGGPKAEADNDALRQQLDSVARTSGSVSATQLELAAAIAANTAAVNANTSKSSTASQVGDLGKSFLNNLTGLSPLVTLFESFFGGGTAAPAKPVPFALPLTVTQNSGITGGGGVVPVDFGASGAPRPQSSSEAAPAPAATQNFFTMQVNALDGQSILDHSDEIASAVRQAMLASHAINDTIAEL